MLNLENFEIYNGRMFYFDKNHYSISEFGKSYMLAVESLDAENPSRVNEKVYTFSTMSAAIAAIEALESGKTV